MEATQVDRTGSAITFPQNQKTGLLRTDGSGHPSPNPEIKIDGFFAFFGFSFPV